MTNEPVNQGLAGSTVPEQTVVLGRSKANASARRMREKLVILSMALVTAAASATAYALLSFSLAGAVLTGGLIWAALMTMHIQIKKSAEIARLKADLVRLETTRTPATASDAHRPRSALDLHMPPGEIDAAMQNNGQRTVTLSVPEGEALHRGLRGAAGGHSGPQPNPRWETAKAPAKPASRKPTAPTPALGNAPPQVVETALWPGTSLSAADPMRDQWAFRPKEPAAPATATLGQNDEMSTLPPPSSTIDADLEMVQRKIKALAEEVNAAEQSRDRQTAPIIPAPTAAALEKSIGALKATAENMRDRKIPPLPHAGSAGPDAVEQSQPLPFELLIPATAERIAVSDPNKSKASAEPSKEPAFELPPLPVFDFSAPPAPNPRLAAIIAAVENGAMDVFLSPIVALQSHEVSHYDVTVRVKNPSGAYLDDAEQELQIAGSDVLALFDTARLKRAALLAQRLDAHKKSGSLLSAVNGPSITNAEFLETFARVFEERDRISNQLVLTFSQADIETFSPSAWQALSDMQAFGFRFALSKIDHASMDFAALASRGFAFLRLEANALLNGLPARDRFFGPDELCRHLAGAGMTLVADTIDDETIRARVFGFGVLFGQGRLFGGARQVKLDPIPDGSSAAA